MSKGRGREINLSTNHMSSSLFVVCLFMSMIGLCVSLTPVCTCPDAVCPDFNWGEVICPPMLSECPPVPNCDANVPTQTIQHMVVEMESFPLDCPAPSCNCTDTCDTTGLDMATLPFRAGTWAILIICTYVLGICTHVAWAHVMRMKWLKQPSPEDPVDIEYTTEMTPMPFSSKYQHLISLTPPKQTNPSHDTCISMMPNIPSVAQSDMGSGLSVQPAIDPEVTRVTVTPNTTRHVMDSKLFTSCPWEPSHGTSMFVNVPTVARPELDAWTDMFSSFGPYVTHRDIDSLFDLRDPSAPRESETEQFMLLWDNVNPLL
jgi:hypothetical protein